MELNWSTFLLEIINFLVLVWLLKRFLFKPVLGIVEKRRLEISRSMNQAEQIRGEAKELQRQYENRLKVWDDEKEAARQLLDKEIAEQRVALLEQLKVELEQHRQQVETAEQRRVNEKIRQNEIIAMQHGAKFAARLLKDVADQSLENLLIELALKEVDNLPEKQKLSIQKALPEHEKEITVVSAYTPAEEQKQSITNCLQRLFNAQIHCRFQTDSQLIAGIRLCAGPWVFHANIQDELKGFVDSTYV